MLLIRATIAAEADDGITWGERQRITSKLDQAGAGAQERGARARAPEPALGRRDHPLGPRPGDREEVYLASRIAMKPDTPAEKAYLDFLAARLEIPADRLQELNGAV